MPHSDLPARRALLLSFAHRDALAGQLGALGYRVLAGRQSDNLRRRLAESAVPLLIVDARGAADDALAAVRALGDAWDSAQTGLLLLYDRADSAILPQFAALGITAMLPHPWHDGELLLALGLAARGAGRVPVNARLFWWRLTGRNILREEIGEEMGGGNSDGPMARLFADARYGDIGGFARTMHPADRRRAFAAWRLLRSGQQYVAFVQAHPPAPVTGQLVHHIIADAGRIAGQVEWLPAVPRRRETGARFSRMSDPVLRRALTRAGEGALLMLLEMTPVQRLARRSDGEIARTIFERAVTERLRGDAVAQHWRIGPQRWLFSLGKAAVGGKAAQQLTLALGIADAHRAHLARHMGADALLVGFAPARAGEAPNALLARLQRQCRPLTAWLGGIDMDAALGQISILYQPQFALDSHDIMGAEALARWQHPQFGRLGPAALFAAARLVGAEAALNRAIRQKILAQMAAWPASAAGLRIGINLDAAILADDGLAAQLLGEAAAAGVAMHRLTIELLESAMLTDPEAVARNLNLLRQAGAKVALDDFGSGYSGLAWLDALPVDYLKMDAARTASVATSTGVVVDLLALAARHGLPMLAEGVENHAEAALLRDMGVRFAQGHGLSPPVEEAALIALLAR